MEAVTPKGRKVNVADESWVGKRGSGNKVLTATYQGVEVAKHVGGLTAPDPVRLLEDADSTLDAMGVE
jgi:hypothetical protein